MANADAVRRHLRDKSEQAAQIAADSVFRQLQDGAPIGIYPEGRPADAGPPTREALDYTRESPADRISYRFVSPGIGGRYVEEGTEPHSIAAQPGKMLRFYWPKVGKVIFTPEVSHPGTTARPWFYPTLQRWHDELAQAFST